MKLLMITRKVDKDDGLAGFTYNWIKKLSFNVEQLYVICLEKGNDQGLPKNIFVHSLGKENGKNRLKEFFRFQYLAIKLVPKVDGIFAHQNPEYGLLISPWSKIFRKKLICWYAHGYVSLRLKLLNFLSNKMITSTPSGFKLKSKKLVILHQGIDTEIFYYNHKEKDGILKFLSVSRISVTKNIHLMIELMSKLKLDYNKKISFKIVGEPTLDADRKYLQDLKSLVYQKELNDEVVFLGSIANNKTPRYYRWADIFLNFSDTASLDKTILEAMSCGTLILTSNESAKVILNNVNSHFCLDDINQAVYKILEIDNIDNNKLGQDLRKIVEKEHSLDDLMKKIVEQF